MHSPYFMCHYTEYKISVFQARILEENKINFATVVHNCKNSRLRVETGEYSTLISASEQFTTAK